MSYWDINKFLAEQQKVQFCFTKDAKHMELLDNTKEGIIHEGQTVHTAIWLANVLNDYLEIGEERNPILKITIPVDFHVKSLDRIDSFRNSHRSTVQKVRTKSEMPYYYEIFQAMKKLTQHYGQTKVDGDKIAKFLIERGKLIISRASSIFEQCRADSITNNYTKFQMDIYKLTRDKSLQYQKWKTA